MPLAATIGDALVAAPIAFLAGLLVGFYFGARFDLLRKDEKG
jgi:hypothetical protein